MEKYLENNIKQGKIIDSYSTENQRLFFDNLITVQELARLLGFAPKTIQNWISLRRIPYLKVGGKVFFRRESLEKWLKRKEIKP